MKFSPKLFLCISLLVIASGKALAAVALPSFFTDNMVLQQKAAVPFFGQSTAELVTVTTSWDKKACTAKTVNGNWQVVLKTPAYGGPFTITINDGKELQLKNILIGEVWLCSGQSNMEMPLQGWGKINNYEEEIRNANYPEIRLLQAERVYSATPLNDLKVQAGGWRVCSPATIPDFSSTAYFFARKIYQEKHIPIGLIHSSWGGTVIEAWISAGSIKPLHDFDSALAAFADPKAKELGQKKYDTDFKVWTDAVNKADKSVFEGKTLWTAVDFNDSQWPAMQLPDYFESAGLPDFDGVVWFRKEVTLPAIKGKDAVFEYYADNDDMLWVNGTYICATQGNKALRHYFIPSSVLKEGRNVVTIRIFDSRGSGGIYGPETLQLMLGNDAYTLKGAWKYAVGSGSKELPVPIQQQWQNSPTALFNAMIYPLLQYKLAGVIWYQGEGNAGRAEQYQTLMPLLINDWRRQFGNKNLPFYYVQLANYRVINPEPGESNWAELREAQFKTLRLPNTGMAVITDIGEANDIHPKNKQDVGLRLAVIALAKTYGVKDMGFSGPLYTSYKAAGKTIVLDFDHNDGIKAKDGDLKGFAIAGKDKKFYWATATVKGGKVVVSSPNVAEPVAVRYNWADNPQGNLTNATGLPASLFRTDTWPGVTAGKK